MEYQFINNKKYVDARKMKNLENQSKITNKQYDELIEKKLSQQQKPSSM